MFFAVCAGLPFAAKAQDSQTPQDQSVADVARHNRKQKKNAARHVRVITNDDLDTKPIKPGQEGLSVGVSFSIQTGAPNASVVAAGKAIGQSAISANIEPGLKDKESEDAAAQGAEVARLEEQLAEAQNQLDRQQRELAEDAEAFRLQKRLAEAQNELTWQQRELVLDQHTIYSNPNYTDNRTGQPKLDSKQQRINEIQEEIESLKGSLAELEWLQWRWQRDTRAEDASPVENYKSALPPTPAPPKL